MWANSHLQGETCICIGACHDMPPNMMAKAVGNTGQIICVIPKKVSPRYPTRIETKQKT